MTWRSSSRAVLQGDGWFTRSGCRLSCSACFLKQRSAGLIRPVPACVSEGQARLRWCVASKCAIEPDRKKGLGFWPNPLSFIGTEGRTRTGMGSLPSDFESDASTNFATPATQLCSIPAVRNHGYPVREGRGCRRSGLTAPVSSGASPSARISVRRNRRADTADWPRRDPSPRRGLARTSWRVWSGSRRDLARRPS